MKTTFIPEVLFNGQELVIKQPVTVEDGEIIALDTVKGSKEVALDGILTAGFIDTQVNGGGGLLFNHQPNQTTLSAMVNAHAKFGSTALLPTLITSDIDTLVQAADVISQAVAAETAGILGIHFEGPHLSKEKNGIHSREHIRPLSDDEMAVYCRDDLGQKILTIAPENVCIDYIKTLVAHDVKVCIGHSNADVQQTQAALAAGASGFTHLFNAMSGLQSRSPNVVGAALADENSWCGLILDGLHVHPVSAKVAHRAKPQGKMMLVTDAMSTIGSDQTRLTFDGHQIELVGNQLTSNTGQLAGSALEMITAVNNAQSMLGTSLTESLNMASLYPAQFLNIEHQRGQIKLGARADFTLLSTQHKQYQVQASWIAGAQVF